ncbi:epoxyqueuosine reductase QueH [candidate division KSB1 bacterium]|nr:epoxyqueuosine reductase QueH [candidate division KSB1 bacterium]
MTNGLIQPQLLLQICCAPDASVVFERLRSSYDITGYFYNPNIHPKEEYDLRAEETMRLAEKMMIPMEPAPYDPQNWFAMTKGKESEPESGERCRICIWMRLEKTAQFASENNFNLFTTTLSVSPHKNADLINELGAEVSEIYGVEFLQANFKKHDGYKRSLELCRLYNVYRQNYCGCLYSKENLEAETDENDLLALPFGL